MNVLRKINLGLVGVSGRGSSFKDICHALDAVRVHAVCDINETVRDQAAAALGAREKYHSYESMLEHSELDAVIIATPMYLHADQAIMALKRHLHVLSEVPAAVSLEECRRLVETCKQSRGVYMMAENANYFRQNVLVRELVRQGLFGQTYYAEGEYLHELKELNEQTAWRRQWQTGIDGITYGTHSLGPILEWMPDDRITRVCCAGSGHHARDRRGESYGAQDTGVMLCQMQSGGLVKIRVDMLSDRPEWLNNYYQLQGTDGCYESARAEGEKNRIWLRTKDPNREKWMELEELESDFLPAMWREVGDAAKKAGHGGSDYFEIVDFVAAVQNKRPVSIGIHQAMDMTIPGLVSQQSVKQDGSWFPVPNSRLW